MSYIPTMEQAQQLLQTYNTEPFHLRHAQIVSGVMGAFAGECDPENEQYWRAVGLLHDLDFEQWPQQHCVKTAELIREADIDPAFIHACVSHGWGMTETDAQPQLRMEKVLFAVDELTGLIGAVALMRPSKSVSDLEAKSVLKKFKQSSFAAGCSRETIQKGADMLEMPLDELIDRTINAMRALSDRMEI